MLNEYTTGTIYDEMITHNGEVRPFYSGLKQKMELMGSAELVKRKVSAEKVLMSLGITFTLNHNEKQEDRILPFDIIPRIISALEWEKLEKGLVQRTRALNLFLQDIYSKKSIIKDKVIPGDMIKSSPGYLKQCEGLLPAKGIWTHISGTDLIRDTDGAYLVLEDNLRCPSGVSYVLENREVMKRIFPEFFHRLSIRPVYDYALRLREALSYLSDEENPNIAVLTPGIYNSAYYEHSFLAHRMGVHLVEGKDLIVQDGYVKMKTTRGLQKVDVIYRRIDDTYLDPQAFNPDSMLGVPGLYNVYKKGNVVLANAPGTGVADDKVIYAFVPEMIRYYLSEEPLIANVPTYLCSREKDLKYVTENIDKLVIKAANGAGGYGMLIGPKSDKTEQEDFKKKIKANPRNYIAQPMVSLSTVPTVIDDKIEGRHVDLRPYIVYGKDIYVLPSGLTRVALKKGSIVVNSSQGGGTKDTWVLAE